jgi:phosphatidylglycerophosphatase A
MTAKHRRDRSPDSDRSPAKDHFPAGEDPEADDEQESPSTKGTYLPPGSWTDMEEDFPVGLTRAKETSEEVASRGSDASSFLFEIRLEVATFFGCGLTPYASGTVGSAATLPLAFLIAEAGYWTFIAATAAAIGLAFWSAGAGVQKYGTLDPKQVVIDEVAGQMVALLFVPISLLGWGISFLLFRFFDIVKPPPASQLERVPGAPGIVLDDLAAGLYANLVLHAIPRVAHWMGFPGVAHWMGWP